MSGYRQFKRGKTHAFGSADWDESKHARDKGKFAPKEGAGAEEDEPKKEGGGDGTTKGMVDGLRLSLGVPPFNDIRIGEPRDGGLMEVDYDGNLTINALASRREVVDDAIGENQRKYEESGGKGYATTFRNSEELIVHELGHHAAYVYAKQHKLKQFWYADRFGINNKAGFKSINQGKMTRGAKKEAAAISHYASQDIHEAFAEVWTLDATGRRDEVPEKYLSAVDELKDWLSKEPA